MVNSVALNSWATSGIKLCDLPALTYSEGGDNSQRLTSLSAAMKDGNTSVAAACRLLRAAPGVQEHQDKGKGKKKGAKSKTPTAKPPEEAPVAAIAEPAQAYSLNTVVYGSPFVAF